MKNTNPLRIGQLWLEECKVTKKEKKKMKIHKHFLKVFCLRNKTSIPLFYRRIKYKYEFGCI